ncbi:MAG: CmcJ/NvfI family oxidoreductase [Pseudomonadota bacterium]|nr:CmcJ/NvfI family oxidoreductase [Pseudomonadota bacterium]
MGQTETLSSTGIDLPNVSGSLAFIKPQDTKPIFHSSALTGAIPKVFFELEAHDVAVADMRPVAPELSVDKEGFELLLQPTAVDDLYDDAVVESDYYAEIQVLLRERFGASRIEIFDKTRRSDSRSGAKNPDGLRGPATRVHVDYTVKSGPQRAKDVLGQAEFKRLIAAGMRIIQINVWRPISGPVKRSPLAVADASSIARHELVATDQIFPDRVGEIYHLAHGSGQRWYYASEMTRDEVLLIKGWDSMDDGRAQFTPHGAFDLTGSEVAPPRESIEIRTFVLIE